MAEMQDPPLAPGPFPPPGYRPPLDPQLEADLAEAIANGFSSSPNGRIVVVPSDPANGVPLAQIVYEGNPTGEVK